MTTMPDRAAASVGNQHFNPAPLPAIGLAAAPRRRTVLARTIESVVIPRLVEAHRAQTTGGFGAAARSGALTASSVEEFAHLILDNEVPTATAYLAAMRERGAALDTLYLDLLAPAARHLGVLWEEDLCDFTQVTTGLWRIQQVLHAFSDAFQAEAARLDPRRQALLVPAPGDQHTFGLVMVAEFFRRDGWAVWSGSPRTTSELLGMVRAEWFGVIGFSLTADSKLGPLAGCIRQIRRASRNRAIGVMVGGRVFVDRPDLVAEVGADATAEDGREAVQEADLLLDRLAGPQLLATAPGLRTVARN